ncbi:hypothetical protein K493DRAFT_308109 [Basidiobolus meristosporus CBS 931.73]|uniref:Uncharacterized protein n=1 Tax=Basidiobolus meristosporus CBS 931.73 TaxID=1314790 RepID=A0A1Y1X698_9FUNG|nr:hypothetical protein K493DRAFT_308109 [Basidiobolus meristosporus CBS 931.73]|eukprot:ORX81313.1 hypothetical protein K493DRAFT_308109 [Basidiobolus meristosporus CBS 931.73]
MELSTSTGLLPPTFSTFHHVPLSHPQFQPQHESTGPNSENSHTFKHIVIPMMVGLVLLLIGTVLYIRHRYVHFKKSQASVHTYMDHAIHGYPVADEMLPPYSQEGLSVPAAIAQKITRCTHQCVLYGVTNDANQPGGFSHGGVSPPPYQVAASSNLPRN